MKLTSADKAKVKLFQIVFQRIKKITGNCLIAFCRAIQQTNDEKTGNKAEQHPELIKQWQKQRDRKSNFRRIKNGTQ